VFKVRREQMDAYRTAARRDFEDRVVEHVGRCFPDRLATMGEGGVRELIRFGIQRAAGYGIVAERYVCKFIDLMLVFGLEFDTEQGWAMEILAVQLPQFRKMRQLFDRALAEVSE